MESLRPKISRQKSLKRYLKTLGISKRHKNPVTNITGFFRVDNQI